MGRATRCACALLLVTSSAAADDAKFVVAGDPSDFQIQTRREARFEWTTLCRIPCVVTAPIAGRFRIGGSDVDPSRVFAPPNHRTSYVLQAHVRHPHERRVGGQIMIAGMIVAGVGGIGMAVGAVWAEVLYSANCANFFTPCTHYNSLRPGITFLIGAAVAVVGGVMTIAGFDQRRASKLDWIDEPGSDVKAPSAQSFEIVRSTF